MHKPVCLSAMGSPLSSIVANLHMEAFKEKALSAATLKPKIMWVRYVDMTHSSSGQMMRIEVLRTFHMQSPQCTTPSDLVHYGGRVGRTNTFPRHSGGEGREAHRHGQVQRFSKILKHHSKSRCYALTNQTIKPAHTCVIFMHAFHYAILIG